jgi:hypothetical protein
LSLRARVLSAVRREPAPIRSRVRIRNAALLLSGFVVPVIGLLAFGGVWAGPRPAVLVAETAIGAGAIALTASVVALSRGRSVLGRTAAWLSGLVVMTPVVLFVWKIAVSSRFDDMMVKWPERVGLRCLWLSCLLAAWPLVAFVMIRKRSDPTHPWLTGAATGAAVGASMWVLVDLACPVSYVPHLLLGHVLPLMIITGAGAVLGRRFIGIRSR